MAEKQPSLFARKRTSRSVPSSPDISNPRTETPIWEPDDGPSTSSQCSSPLLSNNRRKSRFSFYSHRSGSSSRKVKNTSKFLDIFQWFRKRKHSKNDSIESSSTHTNESIASLSSVVLEKRISPLSKNDESKKKLKSFKIPNRIASENSSEDHLQCASNIDEFGDQSEPSLSSLKKRAAPEPPWVCNYRHVASESTSNECNPLPCPSSRCSWADSSNPFYEECKRNSNGSMNGKDDRSSRNSNGSAINNGKTKRKAPMPPVDNGMVKHNQRITQSENSSKDINNENLSTTSTLQSIQSFGNSTLKGSLSSRCSGESFLLEKHVMCEEICRESNSNREKESNSSSPIPRPWYKRKKKTKTVKKSDKVAILDQAYEFWRPEIQFSDGKISSANKSVSESLAQTDEKGYKKKVKRTSQVYLLASISQLDKEAEEHLRKEKELLRAEKNSYDSAFYKSTTPHMLTQMDVLRNSPSHSPNVNDNRLRVQKQNGSESLKSYTQQSTLKLGETTSCHKNESDGSTKSTTNTQVPLKCYKGEITTNCTGSNKDGLNKVTDWPLSRYDFITPPSALTSTMASTGQDTTTQINDSIQSKSNRSSPSLIQQANFDAELFYQLAKDARNTTDCKSSLIIPEKRIPVKNVALSHEQDRDRARITPKLPQKTVRNFGLRMNQPFTPDVSVILEGSESVTSSTTPADDIFSELASCAATELNNDLLQQENNDHDYFASESLFTSVDARELIREIADVRQEIERINEEEDRDMLKRETDKAIKIKQEVRMLRESDNFLMWQDLVSHSSNLPLAGLGKPLPIDITGSKPESKWKWICDTCTLINLPWRITCEACLTRRPLQPTRVREDGSRVSPSKDENMGGSAIEENTRQNALVSEVPQSARNLINSLTTSQQQANWESELQHYFRAVGDCSQDNESIILYNKVQKESTPINNCQNNEASTKERGHTEEVAEVQPSLNELRKARLKRFEKQKVLSTDSNRIPLAKAESSFKEEACEKLNIRDSNFEPGTDKMFYSNETRKRPLIQTLGAVKNTISIFNQKDQLVKINKGKNIQSANHTKRRSSGSIRDQAMMFENMKTKGLEFSGNCAQYLKEYPKPNIKDKFHDINISSAISKFDEIAARAEIERLNPKLSVERFSKKPRRVIIQTKNLSDSNQNNKVKNRFAEPNMMALNAASEKEDNGQSLKLHENNKENSSLVSAVPIELETTLHDGVLYSSESSSRHRAMSMTSSTFELMNEYEFEEIEAEHSQRGSPTSNYQDASFDQDNDSDTTGSFVDAVPGDMSSESYLDADKYPRNGAQRNDSKASSVVNYAVRNENLQSVEDLHRSEILKKLTQSEGIASFKASFVTDSGHMSALSAVDISRLLKNLEAAISEGNHVEAVTLARELEALRVACGGVSATETFFDSQNSTTSNQNTSLHIENIQNAKHQNENEDTDHLNSPFFLSLASTSNSGHGNKCDLPVRESLPSDVNTKLPKEIRTNTEPQFRGEPVSSVRNKLPNLADGHVSEGTHQINVSVQKRDVTRTSAIHRREVKSDNVSRLTEAPGPEALNMPNQVEMFNVQMYVEDRTSHQGPIDVSVNANMTVGELRSKVYEDFGFPPEIQRWILGRRLAEDHAQTLAQHKVTYEGCPIFLYLVAPRPQTPLSQGSLKGQDPETNTKNCSPKLNDTRNLDIAVSIPSSTQPNSTSRQRLISPSIIRLEAAKRNNTGSPEVTKSDVEDPVKGNEWIRQQEVLEMRDDVQFYKKDVKGKYSGKENDNEFLTGEPSLFFSSSKLPELHTRLSNKTNKFSIAFANSRKMGFSQRSENNTQDKTKLVATLTEQGTKTNLRVVVPDSLSLIRSQQESSKVLPEIKIPSFASENYLGRKINSPQVDRKIKPQCNNTPLSSENVPTSAEPAVKIRTDNGRNKSSPNLMSKHKTTSDAAGTVSMNERVLHVDETIEDENGWACPTCTLVNTINRPGCEACATERPADIAATFSASMCSLISNRPLKSLVSSLEIEGAVRSKERFECRICFMNVDPGQGVILRDCLHSFCRECLANAVRYSETAAVRCPYMDKTYSCDFTLQEREIRDLVSEADYEKHLNKSVKQAIGAMQNVFHCKTPDCRGFCVYEDNVNLFLCTVCYKQNCLTCQAQHAGQSCRQYQEMVILKQDMDSLKTQKFFEDMIKRGDGMPCPSCSVMLMRKWGCDWMRCPMCRTEICWVTRGPRWGPKGQGDTTGGCQCGVKGRKCHPKCTYCH